MSLSGRLSPRAREPNRAAWLTPRARKAASFCRSLSRISSRSAILFPYTGCILSHTRLTGKLMPGPPVASGAESEVSARSGKYGRQQAMNFTRQCGKAALSAAALAGRGRLAEVPDREATGFGLVGEV